MGIALILLLLSDNQHYIIKSRYKLIAFSAISLVVFFIIISTSTYISVFQRTGEVDILRSIGASKRDIFLVFNTETFIVGLGSDVVGIGITLLLIIHMDGCIKKIIGASAIYELPVVAGMVLVISSMIVCFMAGLAPSIIAAKKA